LMTLNLPFKINVTVCAHKFDAHSSMRTNQVQFFEYAPT
jgi:hypothetical protein